jgi:hypothetical protein
LTFLSPKQRLRILRYSVSGALDSLFQIVSLFFDLFSQFLDFFTHNCPLCFYIIAQNKKNLKTVLIVFSKNACKKFSNERTAWRCKPASTALSYNILKKECFAIPTIATKSATLQIAMLFSASWLHLLVSLALRGNHPHECLT